MILHTCEITSGYFDLNMKKKEIILCTCELTVDFLIHISGKINDITHLRIYKWFFQFTQEKGKWYSTLMELQVFLKIQLCEKINYIAHLWVHK
jgi:hypothetical protein